MNRKNRRIPFAPISQQPKIAPLIIAELGDQGDGIAYDHDRPLFVPYSLPHEHVKAEIHSGSRAHILEIIKPSPDRVSPPCRYFTQCGGCQLQHWRHEAYLQWKKEQVAMQLKRHAPSLGQPDLDIFSISPGNRRRVTFSIRKSSNALQFGFRKAHRHEIVEIEQCLVALPIINQAIPELRSFFASLLPAGKEVSCLVTAADNGLDIHIHAEWELNEKQRLLLSNIVPPKSFLRFTWQRGQAPAEPIFQIAAPHLRLGEVLIELPPGAFLQPSREGENMLCRWVDENIGKARHIADLYCGIGTFALPLAARAKIFAADVTGNAIEALKRASRQTGLDGKIRAEKRDLQRSPLSLEELEDFDALIFDPPRAGAQPQSRILARSQVPVVIAISCQAVSFAKDAEILVKGGYRMEKIRVLDQFSYSSHSEIFALFRKG